ncbi:MAG: hypothetical protein NUK54_02640 [Methanothrix sp.]|nr:hypothetical protein [Methanothrix sp.]
MKKILLLTALFSTLAFFLAGTSLAQETGREMLIQDSGNETIVNLAGLYSSGFLSVGEAVKFTPPRPGWTLDAVHILGWNGYDGNESLPEEQVISMEVRDENLNLLYRFTDSQLPYFTFVGQPGIGVIEVPSLPISGDFYVCFYDRGAVDVGIDRNDVEGSSYFFDMQTKELFPAEVGIVGSEELVAVSWIIRALGH